MTDVQGFLAFLKFSIFLQGLIHNVLGGRNFFRKNLQGLIYKVLSSHKKYSQKEGGMFHSLACEVRMLIMPPTL